MTLPEPSIASDFASHTDCQGTHRGIQTILLAEKSGSKEHVRPLRKTIVTCSYSRSLLIIDLALSPMLITRRADAMLEEVMAGLIVYFDKCLGNNLLYRFERAQYVNARKEFPNKPMSEIYGAEHLLRLFGECGQQTGQIRGVV